MALVESHREEDAQWFAMPKGGLVYRCAQCGRTGTKDEMLRHRENAGLCRNRVMPGRLP